MHLSRPATIVEIGLWKPKSESGTNVAMNEVFFTLYDDVFYGLEIPVVHFQYHGNAK